MATVEKMTDRLRRLRERLQRQRDWIKEHGGDVSGYIRRYGDPGVPPCDKNGNAETVRVADEELAEQLGLRPVGPEAPNCYYKEMFGSGGTLIYQADNDCLESLERAVADMEHRYGHLVRWEDEERRPIMEADGRYRGPTRGLTPEILLADMQARINQAIVGSGGSPELRELRDILFLGRRFLGLAVPSLSDDDNLLDRPWSE